MEENGHQSIEYWSIYISQKNNLEEVLEPGTDCCIYRVPQYLREINEEAYTPRLISIGPLHYGRKEFMGMENQKTRFWSLFWERENNAQKLEEFKTYIENQEQRIRNHYSVSSTLQSLEYVAMIQRDTVFIIELLLRNYHGTIDFLLEDPLATPIIVDLLLLENQVPYFVLNDLYTIVFRTIDPSFFILSLDFFCGILMIFNNMLFLDDKPQIKHFTDFVRCALVTEVEQAKQSIEGRINDLPSATKLKGSGLKFRGIKEELFLDISLKKGKYGKWFSWYQGKELQIPCIEIYDSTECLFRNMMALEMFRYPKETHICNYAKLMDCLIDTAKDVDLLVEKGAIVNHMGDNEVIAKMFNRLGSYVILSNNSFYYDTVEEMKAHYKYPWNHVKATLKSVYFGNLWTSTATVAAAFLLLFTAIQAICSLKQVL